MQSRARPWNVMQDQVLYKPEGCTPASMGRTPTCAARADKAYQAAHLSVQVIRAECCLMAQARILAACDPPEVVHVACSCCAVAAASAGLWPRSASTPRTARKGTQGGGRTLYAQGALCAEGCKVGKLGTQQCMLVFAFKLAERRAKPGQARGISCIVPYAGVPGMCGARTRGFFQGVGTERSGGGPAPAPSSAGVPPFCTSLF